jgi:hypothetical protein
LAGGFGSRENPAVSLSEALPGVRFLRRVALGFSLAGLPDDLIALALAGFVVFGDFAGMSVTPCQQNVCHFMFR